MTLTYTTARTQIADFLGWGRGGNWSDDDSARLDEILNAGHQQFVYHPPPPGENTSHRWSFLQPRMPFDTEANVWVYTLPGDFGAMVGDLTYGADEDIHRIIEQTTPGMIDRNRAVNDYADRPYLFALQPKSVGQTSEQVTQLLLYPTPGAVYELVYYYHAKVVSLSETNPYFLGGQAHGETILQSCRDIAATRYKDDAGGREHQLFMERLKASVEMDRRLSPKTLGVNRDGQYITHTRHGTEFSVSLKHNLGGG